MKHLLRGAFFLALLALVSHVIPCALGQRDISKTRLIDAEAQWVWQNPLPQGNDLRDASFVDANTGTVVGYYGTIVRTADGGESWVIQTSGTTQNLWGVSFSDANNGTTVGEGGTILRTTDGGNHWISQTSGTTEEIRGVYFTDANTGTAVGLNGTILRTTDGDRTGLVRQAEPQIASLQFPLPMQIQELLLVELLAKVQFSEQPMAEVPGLVSQTEAEYFFLAFPLPTQTPELRLVMVVQFSEQQMEDKHGLARQVAPLTCLMMFHFLMQITGPLLVSISVVRVLSSEPLMAETTGFNKQPEQ